MTRIKRFYDVHEPNEKFLKYGVSITSEMAFTESLLLRKGHFLSRKRGCLFKKYFFRSLNGAFKPRKKGTFFTFKKSGGAQAPIAPRFRGPCTVLVLERCKYFKSKMVGASVEKDNDSWKAAV
jgi:hypothetical protein